MSPRPCRATAHQTDNAMKILVFQHIESEHPGSFREVMEAQGHSMHAVELDAGEPIPPLEDYDILLVMGGPMDVWEAEKHPWLADGNGSDTRLGCGRAALSRPMPRPPITGAGLRRPCAVDDGTAGSRHVAGDGRARSDFRRRRAALHLLSMAWRGSRAAAAGRAGTGDLAGLPHPGFRDWASGLWAAIPYGADRDDGRPNGAACRNTPPRWNA